MSYWIEVRCARQIADSCYSKKIIHTPMEMTKTTSLASINATTLRLTKEAKKLGWIQTDEGWICPECEYRILR